MTSETRYFHFKERNNAHIGLTIASRPIPGSTAVAIGMSLCHHGDNGSRAMGRMVAGDRSARITYEDVARFLPYSFNAGPGVYLLGPGEGVTQSLAHAKAFVSGLRRYSFRANPKDMRNAMRNAFFNGLAPEGTVWPS